MLEFADAAFADAVLDAAPVIVLVLDAEGRIVHYNAFMERLCGRPIAEVRGRDWFTEFLFEADRGPVRALFERTRGEPVRANVNAIRGRQGEARLIEWHDRKLEGAGQAARVVAVGIDITERVRLAGERSELAERFELFAGEVDEVFFLGDHAQQRLLYVSPAYDRMTGQSRELVLAGPGFGRELIHPDDLPLVQREFANHATTSHQLELRILRRSSNAELELRWLSVRWSDLRQHEGDARFVGVMTDISDRKQASAQLRELGHVLELLELAVDEIIVVLDPGYTRALYVSQSLERLGLPRAPLYDDLRRSFEWIHPDDRMLVASTLAAPSTEHPYVYRLCLPDARVRWFETRLRRLGPDSPLPGAYVAIAIDITARIEAEDALRSLKTQLEAHVAERTAALECERSRLGESLDRLADAQRIADVGDWEWELADQRLRWSDQLYRIFGREPGSAVDYGVFMAAIHPDDRDEVARTITGALERRESYEFEHRVIHPGGEIRVVHCLGETIVDAEGHPLRLKGTSQDITRRKADEARLRASLAEKEALLHEIHHRVKNNLQVVASLLYLEGANAGDETRAVLDDCSARIRSMALIHDYLYHSDNLARIDMVDFMRRLGDEVSRIFASQRIIRIHVRGGGLLLDIERAVPVALLTNELLTNALKYAYPDLAAGGVAEIRIDVRPESIEIVDDGVGLPDDIEQSAAESLGLRLVHSLARQLGAHFRFVPGPGTRARLELGPADPSIGVGQDS